MIVSGTGKCLGWLCSVAASFSSPNVHTADCASFQPLRSQHNASRLVFGPYHNSELQPFPTSPFPAPHPMKTSLILPRTSNQPIFSKLFGGNVCEQQTVLGRLLNTVKQSNFYVSFIRVLTILGWL